MAGDGGTVGGFVGAEDRKVILDLKGFDLYLKCNEK